MNVLNIVDCESTCFKLRHLTSFRASVLAIIFTRLIIIYNLSPVNSYDVTHFGLITCCSFCFCCLVLAVSAGAFLGVVMGVAIDDVVGIGVADAVVSVAASLDGAYLIIVSDVATDAVVVVSGVCCCCCCTTSTYIVNGNCFFDFRYDDIEGNLVFLTSTK